MAAMAVRVLTSGGPKSKFVCNMFFYVSAKFAAFITKRTIVLVCFLTDYTHTPTHTYTHLHTYIII